jgi:hypothetical protein
VVGDKEYASLFAIVQHFSNVGLPPRDEILPIGHTGKLDVDNVYVVNFDQIKEVAYVLPINLRRDQPFPTKQEEITAFFSVPARTTWGDDRHWELLRNQYAAKLDQKKATAQL